MSSTIVTFYFNLKNLEDSNHGTRDVSFYLENGKHTLQINNPMVIFCDDVTRPVIQKIREELTSAPTMYIEKNIDEYDHYWMNYSTIKKNRKDTRTYLDPTSRSTISYLLLCTFKIHALKIAKERNDFDSTHFIWMDFGCGHVVYRPVDVAVSRVLAAPRDKVACLYIHYRSRESLKDMESSVTRGICGIAGTFFSVETGYIDRLFTVMQTIFYEMLAKKIGHNDEQILTYAYDRYPELFSLYYGDYYSTISNYHTSIEDHASIKKLFIKPAIAAGRVDLAKQAINSMVVDNLSQGEQDYLTLISGLCD
jgi:hypothetical protein